jgi:hypothetical protein
VYPQLQSFGAIVVVALTTAFGVSVLVLPSLLVLWSRSGPSDTVVITDDGTDRLTYFPRILDENTGLI